ncbi:MAG TPA: MarR family transcriptional regulator [Chloroflexota bacterium]|nr:MarR family transcriptional regulator [Chloroflexota bacterium]
MSPMRELDLSTLLSWLLIAYTMELDNEFEHRMAAVEQHRAFGTSLVLWENFLQYINPEGTGVGDLVKRAGIAPQTVHMYLATERWGYVTVERHRADRRTGRPRPEWVVRRTAVGERAGAVWPELHDVVEQRWIDRFEAAVVSDLRRSLQAIVADLGVDRPRYLPMVGFADGMRAHLPPVEARRPPRSSDGTERVSLATLLSLVLVELTIDFERRSHLSLALSATVLRALDDGAQRMRDLPSLTGVPKETIRASTGFLARQGYVTIEADAMSRTGTVRLTPEGRHARRAYLQLVEEVRAEWEGRFGRATVEQLRESLLRVLEQRDGDHYRLSHGLVPYPEGWRAKRPYLTQTRAMIADPTTALPHYPLITHRGGWPDGS